MATIGNLPPPIQRSGSAERDDARGWDPTGRSQEQATDLDRLRYGPSTADLLSGNAAGSAGHAGSGSGEAPSAQALMADFQATIDADPLALHGAVISAFADKADIAALRGMADRIEAGDLPAPGAIRFVEAGALGADNLGAYAADGASGSGAIYLDERLIGDAALLRATFAEEMGHHVDALLGGADAAGDEGAIFARRLLSGPLDAASLDALRSENDHGRIELGGASFAVEFRGEAGHPGGGTAAATDDDIDDGGNPGGGGGGGGVGGNTGEDNVGDGDGGGGGGNQVGHPGGGTAPATDDDIDDEDDDESVDGPENGTDDEPSYDPAPVPQGQPPVPGIQPAPAPVPQNEPPIPGIQPHEPKPPGDTPPDLGGDEPPVDPAEPRPPYAEAGLGAVVREVIKWVARVIGGRGEPGNPGGGRPPSAEPAAPVAGAPLPGPVTVPPVPPLPPLPGVPPFDPLGAPVPPSPQEEFPDGIPGIASPLEPLGDDPMLSEPTDQEQVSSAAPEPPLGGVLANGRTPTASEVEEYAESQGWTPDQSENGPVKYRDENGVARVTIKSGSSRTEGSEGPHLELRNASNERVDRDGNLVLTRIEVRSV